MSVTVVEVSIPSPKQKPKQEKEQLTIDTTCNRGTMRVKVRLVMPQPTEKCPSCGTTDSNCFFEEHEYCSDCECRQQGLDMDLAERDRQEDQPPFVVN